MLPPDCLNSQWHTERTIRRRHLLSLLSSDSIKFHMIKDPLNVVRGASHQSHSTWHARPRRDIPSIPTDYLSTLNYATSCRTLTKSSPYCMKRSGMQFWCSAMFAHCLFIIQFFFVWYQRVDSLNLEMIQLTVGCLPNPFAFYSCVFLRRNRPKSCPEEHP